MATDSESFNRDLYDLLKVRGYKPVPLDSKNQRVSASQDSDVIEFQFNKDGEDYGKVWATVDDAQNLIIYYDSEQQDSPSTRTPGVDYDDSWTGLLKFLKMWAQRRQMSFELSNKDRLGDDMRQRDYHKMKEKLGESYHPMGKKASYNDAVPSVKIILQHNRALEEGEQRYRNVARIFLENQDGERFLAPTTRPGIARVYARHIAEGGLPNDERWNHIKSICEDYNKMAGFVRATRNGQFNESAQALVNEGINHYNSLRENLHKMTTHRGYQAYFESWTPTLMESEGEDVSEMFMSSTLDPRIESAMPILSRLHKPVAEMCEVDTLAEWADSILSEKLEMAEGFFDKPKFTCVAANHKPEEFEAETKEEAQKLAAKKWGVDPKTVNVKDPNAEKDSTAKPETKPKDDHRPSDPIEAAKKDAADKLKAGAVGGAVGTAGKIVGGALGLREAGEESIQSNNPVGIPEGEVVPFKKKHEDDDDDDWDDDSWMPSIEDFEQEEEIRQYNKNHRKPANDLEEMEKDLYQGRRHDPRKGPQGPDKIAKAITVKKATKDAGKLLNKAFRGELEEDLGPEQKRVGQLGPTEKVKNNNIGKLVGASESKEIDPELARIIEMARFKR